MLLCDAQECLRCWDTLKADLLWRSFCRTKRSETAWQPMFTWWLHVWAGLSFSTAFRGDCLVFASGKYLWLNNNYKYHRGPRLSLWLLGQNGGVEIIKICTELYRWSQKRRKCNRQTAKFTFYFIRCLCDVSWLCLGILSHFSRFLKFKFTLT